MTANPQPSILNPHSDRRIIAQAGIRILAEYLRKNAKGAAAARPKWRVRAELHAAGLRLTSREFDWTAHEAVLQGHPIGSSDKGFFFVETRDDFAAARAYLVCRFGPMKERILAIEKMAADRFGEPTLFEG